MAPAELVASAVTSACGAITGGVVSSTVTLKLPFAVFPAASEAEQLTVVVPITKVEPEAGKQLMGTGPSTASLAEAL